MCANYGGVTLLGFFCHMRFLNLSSSKNHYALCPMHFITMQFYFLFQTLEKGEIKSRSNRVVDACAWCLWISRAARLRAELQDQLHPDVPESRSNGQNVCSAPLVTGLKSLSCRCWLLSSMLHCTCVPWLHFTAEWPLRLFILFIYLFFG